MLIHASHGKNRCTCIYIYIVTHQKYMMLRYEKYCNDINIIVIYLICINMNWASHCEINAKTSAVTLLRPFNDNSSITTTHCRTTASSCCISCTAACSEPTHTYVHVSAHTFFLSVSLLGLLRRSWMNFHEISEEGKPYDKKQFIRFLGWNCIWI